MKLKLSDTLYNWVNVRAKQETCNVKMPTAFPNLISPALRLMEF